MRGKLRRSRRRAGSRDHRACSTPCPRRLEPAIDGPLVEVARIAGQFAKPRSANEESHDGITLPAYRGDIVNGIEFAASARDADPSRMIRAHMQSVGTAASLAAARGSGAPIFTSHEALLLPYEEPLTRRDAAGRWWATSGPYALARRSHPPARRRSRRISSRHRKCRRHQMRADADRGRAASADRSPRSTRAGRQACPDRPVRRQEDRRAAAAADARHEGPAGDLDDRSDARQHLDASASARFGDCPTSSPRSTPFLRLPRPKAFMPAACIWR